MKRIKICGPRLQIPSRAELSHLTQEMENPPKQVNCDLNPHMKLALAISILKSRRHPAYADKVQSQPSCSNVSESDAIKWKRKVAILIFPSVFCVNLSLNLRCEWSSIFLENFSLNSGKKKSRGLRKISNLLKVSSLFVSLSLGKICDSGN